MNDIDKIPAIIHEDEYLIAVSKKPGELTIPGRNLHECSLSEVLAAYLGKKVFVIHRLDREASGIVLFAKSASAHRCLSLQFERREVRKFYTAAVKGNVERDGSINRPIRQFGSGRMGVDRRGKPSMTKYRVLGSIPSGTLLDIEIVTGRRHQIRVHLYSIGHPILGETRYGKDLPLGGFPRLMLHGRGLHVVTPSGESLKIHSEPSQEFFQLAKTGGNH